LKSLARDGDRAGRRRTSPDLPELDLPELDLPELASPELASPDWGSATGRALDGAVSVTRRSLGDTPDDSVRSSRSSESSSERNRSSIP
jgi:hypothetical protein